MKKGQRGGEKDVPPDREGDLSPPSDSTVAPLTSDSDDSSNRTTLSTVSSSSPEQPPHISVHIDIVQQGSSTSSSTGPFRYERDSISAPASGEDSSCDPAPKESPKRAPLQRGDTLDDVPSLERDPDPGEISQAMEQLDAAELPPSTSGVQPQSKKSLSLMGTSPPLAQRRRLTVPQHSHSSESTTSSDGNAPPGSIVVPQITVTRPSPSKTCQRARAPRLADLPRTPALSSRDEPEALEDSGVGDTSSPGTATGPLNLCAAGERGPHPETSSHSSDSSVLPSPPYKQLAEQGSSSSRKCRPSDMAEAKALLSGRSSASESSEMDTSAGTTSFSTMLDLARPPPPPTPAPTPVRIVPGGEEIVLSSRGYETRSTFAASSTVAPATDCLETTTTDGSPTKRRAKSSPSRDAEGTPSKQRPSRRSPPPRPPPPAL